MLVLGTSRRLLRGACHGRHTLPGTKLPGGRDTAGTQGRGQRRQSRKPRAPPADSQPGPCPRQERARFPSFQSRASWNLHPLGFAIFTHPEPSGLHGDASKQQIPGSNDVTFPFPAAQAWRHCRPGPARPPSAASQTPGPGPGAAAGRSPRPAAWPHGPWAGGLLLLRGPGAATLRPRAEHKAREPPTLLPPAWLPGGGGRAGGHRGRLA